MTPEGRVKNEVKKLFREHKVWWFAPMQNGMGVVGIPDFVGCVPTTITQEMVGQTVGCFIGVETKAPGKLSRATPNQQRVLRDIAKAGGIALLTDDASKLAEILGGIPQQLKE